MKTTSLIALVLVLIGALNWSLVGIFDYNLVDSLFGEGSALSRTIYALVGLAALWRIFVLFIDFDKESEGIRA